MDDANAWGNHFEAIERLHSPLQKLIAGPVTLKLRLHIQLEGFVRPGVVHLYRVIDHEIDGDERLDEFDVFPKSGHGRAHCCQIHEQRYPREILKYDAGNDKRNLFGANSIRFPIRQIANVNFTNLFAIEIPKHRFQDDTNADWKSRDRSHTLLLELR